MGIGKSMAYEQGYYDGFRDAIVKDRYKGKKFANGGIQMNVEKMHELSDSLNRLEALALMIILNNEHDLGYAELHKNTQGDKE